MFRCRRRSTRTGMRVISITLRWPSSLSSLQGSEGIFLRSLFHLIQTLQAGDELFGEWFAGFCPEQAAGNAAVFFDRKGEGQQLFYVLLNAFRRVNVDDFVFQHPW